MDELSEVVSTSSFEFAPDIKVWLTPPQSPSRPTPQKRRIAMRNSSAFAVSLILALFVTVFALTGSLPGWPVIIVIVTLGVHVGTRTWRADSKVADEEEASLLETHGELYRAYLNRKKVWARLVYCSECSSVTDPVTLQSRSLFEIHELANRRSSGVSLR